MDVVRYLVAHGALAAEPVTRSSVVTGAPAYTAFRRGPAAFATLRVLLEAGIPGPSAEALLVTAVMRSALRLARSWQRPSVQFMLGERTAGPDDVPITRTVVRIVPTGVRLACDVFIKPGAEQLERRRWPWS